LRETTSGPLVVLLIRFDSFLSLNHSFLTGGNTGLPHGSIFHVLKAKVMKALTNTAKNESSLMWLKIPGYRQKLSNRKNILHDDLSWLKIYGYRQSGMHSSAQKPVTS